MEQISTLQPMEELLVEQVEVAWRRLRPIENPCRSRPRARAAACGEEPTQDHTGLGGAATCAGTVCYWRVDPMVRNNVGAVLKEPTQDQFGKDGIP